MSLQGNPNLVNNGFDDPPSNPTFLMKKWFENAKSVNIIEPYGFTLATVNELRMPSSRVVVMKDYDDQGITFGTSMKSRKGMELEHIPLASASFWWRETVQQIILNGHVVKQSNELSDKAFSERIKEAQAIASLSHQSAVLDKDLKKAVSIACSEERIVRPDHWCLYKIEPVEIEFWQGNADRFHKRLKYEKASNGDWKYCWLQP